MAYKPYEGDIPNKVFYSISEVSRFTGVEPHVLRYWETKFTKLTPKRVGGNQRKYTRSDLDLLFKIVGLLYEEGYTLEGAERKLKNGSAKRKPSVAKEAASEQPQTKSAGKAAAASSAVDLTEIKKELKAILNLLGN